MNYEIEVSNQIDIAETCAKGIKMRLPYCDLVQILGEPNDSDGYKVDAQWCFKDKTGAVATLYNWKDGPNYTGQGRIEDLKYWNVGGRYKSHKSEAAWLIMHALVERDIDKGITLHQLLGEI